MGNSAHVFIYLSGPGWHILKEHGFLSKHCTYQVPVQSQLGCSHAVLSTVLTGKPPEKHGFFNSYIHKESITKLETAQRLYEKFKGANSGYFGKYSVPMRNLKSFVPSGHEKGSLSLGCCDCENSIIDMIHEKNISHFITSSSNTSLAETFKNIKNLLNNNAFSFVFVEINELDKLLHSFPHNFQLIDDRLRRHENWIRQIISVGKETCSNFNLTVLAGHGMTFAPQKINIKKKINALGLSYGNDYHAVYEPTMACFWFKNAFSKSIIINRLKGLRHCRVLTIKEKKEYGINFSDKRHGETIALVDPGFQIFPNDVLPEALPAMHGYEPNHPDSLGACISTCQFKPSPRHVKDFFAIMADCINQN